MGNAPFTIGLRLDDPRNTEGNGDSNSRRRVHVAGEVLEGCVYLEVRDGTQRASSLNVHFVGTESTSLVPDRNNGSSSNNNEKKEEDDDDVSLLRQTHRIIDVDVPLVKYASGVVRPGRYEYPFRFVLPAHLPSTFDGHASTIPSLLPWGSGSRRAQGHIRYTLEAGLRSPTAGFLTSIWNAASGTTTSKYRGGNYHKQEVRLAATSTEAYAAPPLSSGICETSLRQWYFLPTGGTFLHAVETHANVVALGEFLLVTLSSRNTSHATFSKVTCQLQEVVTLALLPDDRATCTKTLWRTDIAAADIAPLLHRQSQGHSQQRHASGQKDLARHEVCFTVPTTANPSHSGRFIAIHHQLVVQFVPSGSDVTQPETRLALKLVPSPHHQPVPAIAAAATPPSRLFLEADSHTHHQVSPSPMVPPSAPPPEEDGNVPVAVPVYDHADVEQLPVATAAALPADWEAITAEVVTIGATNPHYR